MGQVERSDIEIVQMRCFLLNYALKNSWQDLIFTMICMIPMVNLGVWKMGFMFCDLYVSLK